MIEFFSVSLYQKLIFDFSNWFIQFFFYSLGSTLGVCTTVAQLIGSLLSTGKQSNWSSRSKSPEFDDETALGFKRSLRLFHHRHRPVIINRRPHRPFTTATEEKKRNSPALWLSLIIFDFFFATFFFLSRTDFLRRAHTFCSRGRRIFLKKLKKKNDDEKKTHRRWRREEVAAAACGADGSRTSCALMGGQWPIQTGGRPRGVLHSLAARERCRAPARCRTLAPCTARGPSEGKGGSRGGALLEPRLSSVHRSSRETLRHL